MNMDGWQTKRGPKTAPLQIKKQIRSNSEKDQKHFSQDTAALAELERPADESPETSPFRRVKVSHRTTKIIIYTMSIA